MKERGSLLQDKSDNKSMGDSGINKPMELINENGKWKLKLELKSLKAKVGGFKGYRRARGTRIGTGSRSLLTGPVSPDGEQARAPGGSPFGGPRPLTIRTS